MPDPIRMYLDQMIQVPVRDVLTMSGYDVIRAAEYGQSRADDHEILAKAIRDQRILITLDDHFGDWAVLPLTQHHGVIRLKVNPTTAQNILDLLMPFLARLDREKIVNHLVILSKSKEKWILTGFS